jgi:16S rRNA (guanine527-N7)-methyltransferase
MSAASSREELVEHVVDSLQVVPLIRGRDRVLDVGSGGGFPVVIAAICLPELEMVSLEPVRKKHAFLRTAARELELANLTARAERLEDHAGSDYAVAMSRATFELEEWLQHGLERVRSGGIVIGFEGVERSLTTPVERHRYELNGKSRALVVAAR